jgi:hypothetical protein
MQLDLNSNSNPISEKFNLPEKFPKKFTLPPKLNGKYVNATSSSLIAPFSNAAREMGIPNSFAKIAKGVTQIFVQLGEASAAAIDFVSKCTFFGETVKVLSFTKGLDDIIQNTAKQNETGINLHQRNLGIASGFFQLVISGMAGFKLLDTFKVLSLSNISSVLGTTAVLPFSVVSSGVEIIKNVVDITNKSLKIHKTNGQIDKVKEKQENFKVEKESTNDVANSEKIGAFLTKHIEDMKIKQEAAPDQIATKKDELKAAKKTAKEALLAYQETSKNRKKNKASPEKIAKFINSISLFREKRANKAALFEATAAYDKAYKGLEDADKKLKGRVTKIQAWGNVQNQFNTNVKTNKDLGIENVGIKRNGKELDGSDLVNQMISEKASRWDAIRDNCNFSNFKDGFGIALSVVATIGLIATIILTFTGVGTIPVLLTMTTLWLILALAGLGSTLLDKYKKPLVIPPTNFKYYATAPQAA